MIPVGTRVRLTVPVAFWPIGTKGVVADMPVGMPNGWDLAVWFGPASYGVLCVDTGEVEVAP